mmetsp:Transcript_24171/g.42950  ORF Transcript_24171/g.42950 Transcript_24171/m.42950 type:complete len:751 (-) Transcript_24171:32-2284(-)
MLSLSANSGVISVRHSLSQKMSKGKSTLQDFEFLGKLGQGSFGTVFKVRRKADRNIYVMKQINISSMDRRGQQDAINEVHILASLDSPFIVKYYDSFVEHKVLNIVMEFCEKGDLSKLVKAQMGRLLPEQKIWSYFLQMCLGLEYLHSKKILHRDIKSMNVFMAKEDSLRIGDLGVAKVLSNTAAFAHTMVGTPYYLSPELCEEKPYNVKSDVWALGCVLYEMCTLRHPFDAQNQGALVLKIIRGSFAPVSTQYSSDLRDMLAGCLSKDYRKRFSIKNILKRPGVKEKVIGLNIAIPANSALNEVGISIPESAPSPKFEYKSSLPVVEEEKKPVIRSSSAHRAPEPKPVAKPPIQRVEPSKPMPPRDVPKPAPRKPDEEVKQIVARPSRVRKGAPPGLARNAMQQRAPVKPPSQPAPKPNPTPAPVQAANGAQEKKRSVSNIEKRTLEEIEEIKQVAALSNFEPKHAAVKKPEAKLKPKISVRDLRTPEVPSPIPTPKESTNPDNYKVSVFKPSPPAKQAAQVVQVKQPPYKPAPSPPTFVDDRPSTPPESQIISYHVALLEKQVPDNSASFEGQGLLATCDWNITNSSQGSISIPTVSSSPSDRKGFTVNFASGKVTAEASSDEEEIYDLSDDSEDEFEETSKDGMRLRLRELESKHERFNALISQHKQQIVAAIGQKNFNELYQLYKSKIHSESELGDDEQAEIEAFVYSKLPTEHSDLIYVMYKLLHLEIELVDIQKSATAIRFSLL